MIKNLFVLLGLIPFLLNAQTSVELKYVGMHIIEHNKKIQNTYIGGLSDIGHYHEDTYVIVADKAPARLYYASLGLDEENNIYCEINDEMDAVVEITPTDAELEAVRVFSMEEETFIMTDEREWKSFVRIIGMSGSDRGKVKLPKKFKKQSHNSGFEGMCLTENDLYLSLERPLKKDAECFEPKDDIIGITRILHYDKNDLKKTPKEYGYPLRKQPLDPEGGTGITSIVTLENGNLLAVERSYSRSLKKNSIRIYELDLSKASNIAGYKTVCDIPESTQLLDPKLVFSFDEIGETTRIDNIEGATLSYNGKHLILVSDNNFREAQQTQIIFMEVNAK